MINEKKLISESHKLMEYLEKRNLTKLEQFWKDSNILVKKILEGTNVYETERRNIYKSAVYIKYLRKSLQESSHISIDNKPYYSHIIPFFASKQVQKLKNKVERKKYTSRILYSKMPWLSTKSKKK